MNSTHPSDPAPDPTTRASGTPVCDILSVIVPVLDEAEIIVASLERLQVLRARGHEVIVVDGGSTDGTAALAAQSADRVLFAPRGRASQMNVGANAARGEILLFLHADTFLSAEALRRLCACVYESGWKWGRFDVRLSGRHWLLRVVEFCMNGRSRLTGIATGDQALFVRRSVFEAVGGFPVLPLMEDVAMSRLLKRVGRPLALRQRVVSSSRRWEQHGILRTIVLMWGLRFAFALGVSPDRLARRYESS